MNINKFYNMLDYDLDTADERIKHLKNILEDENGYPRDFFEKCFEQKFDSAGRNVSFTNLTPNSNQGLYSDTAIARLLSTMADYILDCPEEREKSREECGYKIYKDKALFNRAMKEQSLEKMEGDGMDNDIIDILVSDTNYLLSTDQKILKSDMDDPDISKCLGDYKSFLTCMREVREVLSREIRLLTDIKKRTKNFKSIVLEDDIFAIESMGLAVDTSKLQAYYNSISQRLRLIRKHIATVNDDMVNVKDMVKGTIVFKDPLPSTTVPSYQTFDFLDPKQVRALLNIAIPETYDFQDELDCLIYDLNCMVENIGFSDIELDIVDMYRHNLSQYEMSNYILNEYGVEIELYDFSRKLDYISKKITRHYYYKTCDYLVKFRKNKYKCSKCGLERIAEEFNKDERNRFGLKSVCKRCNHAQK